MRTADSRWRDFGCGIYFLVTGILMMILPVVTWQNSIFFAILYTPGLLLGPLFVYWAWMDFRDAIRGSDWEEERI